MKSNHTLRLLVFLVVVLIIFFSFSFYSSKTEEVEEDYIAEEVIQPEDIVPPETEEAPTIEESEEDVEVMNEVIITIKNLKFNPDKITISPGTTVIWINNDTSAHKVVAYDRVFYGPRMGIGDKYEFTFTQEGTHRYFDAVFPKIGRGTVVVKEEPLPLTGGAVGIDLIAKEADGKFALLVLLFVTMVFGLGHGMFTNYGI